MVIETDGISKYDFLNLSETNEGWVVTVESLSSQQIIVNSDEWVFVFVLLEIIKYVGK